MMDITNLRQTKPYFKIYDGRILGGITTALVTGLAISEYIGWQAQRNKPLTLKQGQWKTVRQAFIPDSKRISNIRLYRLGVLASTAMVTQDLLSRSVTNQDTYLWASLANASIHLGLLTGGPFRFGSTTALRSHGARVLGIAGIIFTGFAFLS